MATEEYIVSLGALIDESAVESINTQIKTMQPKLDKVRISIDEMYFNKQLTNIQNQLNRLFKDSDFGKYLSSNLKTVSQEISKTVSDTGQQIKRISQKMRNEIASIANRDGVQNGGISDATNFQDTVRNYFKGIENGTVIAERQIGEATTNIFRNEKGKINGFVIEVKNAANETERLFYKLKPIIENNKKIGDEFVYSHSSITDSNIKLQEEAIRKATQANKEHEAQMRKNEATSIKLQASLDGLKKEYEDLNSARPIRNKDSLKDLGDKYTQITGAVTDLKTAEKDKYAVAKANIESQIKSLKLLIEAYRKAENSGTQLRTKPVEVSKIDEEFKLDAYIAKMQRAGIVAQEFWHKINGVNADGTANQNSLKSKLEAITDTDSLNAYLNLLSNVQAEGKKLIEEKRVNDQQAAQSQENINKVFQRTLELEKQIGQTRVKIAGLDPEKDGAQIAELNNQLNTLVNESQLVKGEFSSAFSTEQILKLNDVIKETENRIAEIKAQLQAAQSQKVAEIKTNFSNGQYEKEVNAVKTSFDSLRNTTTELKTAMDGLDTAYANLKTAQSGNDPQKLVVAEEAYVNALKKVKNQLDINTRTEREQISAEKMAQGKQALYSQIDVWLKNNSAAAKQFGAQLKEIQSQIATVDKTQQLRNLRAEFQEVTRQAAIMGVAGKTAMDRFKDSLKTVTSYFSASMLIMRMISSLRTGVNTVIELDTALVDLKKTTKATREELEQFYYSANETAKRLGTTTKEVIQAAAEWSRLGYSIKDAQTMAETSSIFSSISPNVDILKATDGLVSAMKAFNIEADDALDGIASKINAIGNTQAVSNENIIDFLTRSSSAMKEANNTLDETIALGTAA